MLGVKMMMSAAAAAAAAVETWFFVIQSIIGDFQHVTLVLLILCTFNSLRVYESTADDDEVPVNEAPSNGLQQLMVRQSNLVFKTLDDERQVSTW